MPGSKPGERRGGRKKGVPNKLTSTAKSAFLATFGKLEGDLKRWITETAEGTARPLVVKGEALLDAKGKPITYRDGADPGKAAELLIRMAEFHFPKLGRTEVTGKDGEPVRVSIAINGIRREGMEPPANSGKVPRV